MQIICYIHFVESIAMTFFNGLTLDHYLALKQRWGLQGNELVQKMFYSIAS